MVRTVVSLDPEDKAWLDRVARGERVTMTEIVRRAIRRLRQQSGEPRQNIDALLASTSGLWHAGDGLKYQKKIRSEWDKRG
ncbi:MAG: ribbon-helix-helix protein, CopG family [Burkholderiales bacterium]